MLRRPPRPTRPATLVPYPTLFRSDLRADQEQSAISRHAGDHAVLEGRLVRQGAWSHRGCRTVSDQAVHAGRTAGCHPSPCQHGRSEEHTSELQSLMRISSAVFCLKKKKTITTTHNKDQF